MKTRFIRLKFYIYLYRVILIQDFKCKMSYRVDFIISTLGIVLTNAFGFISYWIIFQHFSSIGGWSYYEMLFLYGLSLLSLTPVQCFFDNNWKLHDKLYSGEFIKYYFCPINIFFYFFSENFDVKGLGQFVFGIVITVISWRELELEVSVINIAIMIFGVISASLFMIAIMNFAAATSFWIIGSSMIMIFIFKFKDYARYPVTIFNSMFKFLFTFVIPIAFIAYYPSLILLRPNEVSALTYLTPIIGSVVVYGSYKFWMYGALNWMGTGA